MPDSDPKRLLTPELSRVTKQCSLHELLGRSSMTASRLPRTSERFGIRPLNQLLKIVGRHGTNIHDCHPVESGHITSWFDAGHVSQLQEAFRGCTNTETPLFWL